MCVLVGLFAASCCDSVPTRRARETGLVMKGQVADSRAWIIHGSSPSCFKSIHCHCQTCICVCLCLCACCVNESFEVSVVCVC
jgi:hypothetical protein